MITPDISVIIPVKDAGAILEECLRAVKSNWGVSYEIIVVNDCSVDNSSDIACKHSCYVINLPQTLGPAFARNIAAGAAHGCILFFIDADVIIFPDTLQKINAIFRDPTIMAISGIQSEANRYKNFFSQYKNLWMRYTYLTLPQTVALFYTSCSAIRRELFLKSGGFNTGYHKPSVEDTDYGQKLARMGYNVHLIKNLEIEHAKKYSLSSILKTDFHRSGALLKLMFRNGIKHSFLKNKTSVPASFAIGVILFLCSIPIIFMAIFIPSVRIYSLPLVILIIVFFLFFNRAFLVWIKERKGILFSCKAVLFLSIDLPVITSGLCFGFISYIKGQRY